MSLTTNEVTSAIRRKLLEETTDLVTDATVLLNVNLAYDDLKIRTFTADQIQTATITFSSGEASVPLDFGTLYGDAYATTTDKTPFPEKSIADFDKDTTINGVTIEGGKIKVAPTDTTSLIIKYYPSYDALSTSQNPEINEYFHELLIYGALSRIHEDLQDEVLSKYYDDKYEALLKKKTDSMSNYEEANDRGGEMFSYQQLI